MEVVDIVVTFYIISRQVQPTAAKIALPRESSYEYFRFPVLCNSRKSFRDPEKSRDDINSTIPEVPKLRQIFQRFVNIIEEAILYNLGHNVRMWRVAHFEYVFRVYVIEGGPGRL
ncbi:10060_t:CDS:2 [Ambispora leptoticha]|uniref:10060_t:CDS:1 n=1 Tax=Ambispora leptoticha TaxID=144679 RepID=A0A9N9A2E6_9GLOM|nr:10060_t:CDS:2 [Ambispora leptoticha]